MKVRKHEVEYTLTEKVCNLGTVEGNITIIHTLDRIGCDFKPNIYQLYKSNELGEQNDIDYKSMPWLERFKDKISGYFVCESDKLKTVKKISEQELFRKKRGLVHNSAYQTYVTTAYKMLKKVVDMEKSE